MNIRDADILIQPGLFAGSEKVWYRRWEIAMNTARRIEQADWKNPDRDAWIGRMITEVAASARPVVLVGHSLGAITVVLAAPKIARLDVRCAFLVAPPDLEANRGSRPEGNSFLPVPEEPLPFPSMLVASRTDPWCGFRRAEKYAAAWGSNLADAGDAGHINAQSGHGPWPEGMMMFARMMAQL